MCTIPRHERDLSWSLFSLWAFKECVQAFLRVLEESVSHTAHLKCYLHSLHDIYLFMISHIAIRGLRFICMYFQEMNLTNCFLAKVLF